MTIRHLNVNYSGYMRRAFSRLTIPSSFPRTTTSYYAMHLTCTCSSLCPLHNVSVVSRVADLYEGPCDRCRGRTVVDDRSDLDDSSSCPELEDYVGTTSNTAVAADDEDDVDSLASAFDAVRIR